jgi:hypothetical protein
MKLFSKLEVSEKNVASVTRSLKTRQACRAPERARYGCTGVQVPVSI